MYLRFLNTLIAAYDRRTANMRGPRDPLTNVLAAISFVQCLNVYAVFRYFVLPDGQQCADCNEDGRVTLPALAWIAILVLNIIAVANSQRDVLLAPAAYQRALRWFYGYLVVTIILLL